jgi:MFS family permease
MTDYAGQQERAFRTLRYRDFRLIWFAEIISVMGSMISQRAAMGWQIYKLTGSEFDLGVLGLAKFAPVLVFGLAGGVIADRGDRRRTLLGAQTMLLVVAISLAVLTFTGLITVWLIYVMAFLDGTFYSFAQPTRQAIIPSLVPRRSLPGAATMGNLGFHAASVSGPAIGGVIIGTLGPGYAYLFDALSFAVVIVAVLMVRTPLGIVAPTATGIHAAREGLSFVRRTPVLFGVMITDAMATFFGFTSVLMPVFAEEVFHTGAEGFGLLLAAPAAGAVAMSIGLSVIRLPNRVGTVVLVSIGLYGLAMTGFGLTSSFPLALGFLALSGAADSISMTCRHTIRQLITPDHLRGRVAAIQRSLGMGGPQLGEFEAGVAASIIGAGPAVVIGGLLATATAGAIAILMPPVIRYRLYRGPGEAESAPAVAD